MTLSFLEWPAGQKILTVYNATAAPAVDDKVVLNGKTYKVVSRVWSYNEPNDPLFGGCQLVQIGLL
jgi:hypothetical protein